MKRSLLKLWHRQAISFASIRDNSILSLSFHLHFTGESNPIYTSNIHPSYYPFSIVRWHLSVVVLRRPPPTLASTSSRWQLIPPSTSALNIVLLLDINLRTMLEKYSLSDWKFHSFSAARPPPPHYNRFCEQTVTPSIVQQSFLSQSFTRFVRPFASLTWPTVHTYICGTSVHFNRRNLHQHIHIYM